MEALERLSLSDLTNLAAEGEDSPMHQGAVAVLDAGPLLDAASHVRIHHVRRQLESKLDRVPELRRVLFRTRMFEGRPLWVDDAAFDIAEHVRVASLPPGEDAALRFAEQRMAGLMDRSRPLWELWFLEGYGPGKVGLFLKLHHALADGPAMLNMLAQVFDLEPSPPRLARSEWCPRPAPRAREILLDNLGRKRDLLVAAARRVAHPSAMMRAVRSTVGGMREALRQGRGAPRTSLNRPIGSARRVGAIHLPLDQVKAVAHASGVKLNDVFMDLVAGGLHAVLESRGERDLEPIHASVAVSLHGAADVATTGNHVGTMIVPLPVVVADPAARLAEIAAATRKAKSVQLAAGSQAVMAALAMTGLTRWYIRRQHMINVLVTNLPGPPVPLYVAGARVEDAVAIPPIAGNVTVSFAAFSYCGRLNLSVHADAQAWPDLEALLDGMRRAWATLVEETALPKPGLLAS